MILAHRDIPMEKGIMMLLIITSAIRFHFPFIPKCRI